MEPGVGQPEETQMLAQRERAPVRDDRLDRAARAGRSSRTSARRRSRCSRETPCVYGRYDARPIARDDVRPLLDRASVPATSFQSRMARSVASTSSRPPSSASSGSAATVLDGNASATVRAWSALPEVLRYAQFSSTTSTRSPSRSNRTTSVDPLEPRSIPMGFEPRPGCLGNHQEGPRRVARQLQQDAALPRVEIDWKEAVPSIHSCGASGDRCRDWR